MKITYCGIGNISFIAEEGTYVAQVMFQIRDDRLTGMQHIAGHELEMKIRVPGDSTWPFERVQEAIRVEASTLLDLARSHLQNATIKSLLEYNRTSDEEANAKQREDLQESLTKSLSTLA